MNHNSQQSFQLNQNRIQFSVEDYPAYVVVKSKRFKQTMHAVYWDGEKILDPNPEIKKNGLPIEQYEIISWFPIIRSY